MVHWELMQLQSDFKKSAIYFEMIFFSEFFSIFFRFVVFSPYSYTHFFMLIYSTFIALHCNTYTTIPIMINSLPSLVQLRKMCFGQFSIGVHSRLTSKDRCTFELSIIVLCNVNLCSTDRFIPQAIACVPRRI